MHVFDCPRCRQTSVVPNSLIGKRVACGGCGNTVDLGGHADVINAQVAQSSPSFADNLLRRQNEAAKNAGDDGNYFEEIDDFPDPARHADPKAWRGVRPQRRIDEAQEDYISPSSNQRSKRRTDPVAESVCEPRKPAYVSKQVRDRHVEIEAAPRRIQPVSHGFVEGAYASPPPYSPYSPARDPLRRGQTRRRGQRSTSALSHMLSALNDADTYGDGMKLVGAAILMGIAGLVVMKIITSIWPITAENAMTILGANLILTVLLGAFWESLILSIMSRQATGREWSPESYGQCMAYWVIGFLLPRVPAIAIVVWCFKTQQIPSTPTIWTIALLAAFGTAYSYVLQGVMSISEYPRPLKALECMARCVPELMLASVVCLCLTIAAVLALLVVVTAIAGVNGKVGADPTQQIWMQILITICSFVLIEFCQAFLISMIARLLGFNRKKFDL